MGSSFGLSSSEWPRRPGCHSGGTVAQLRRECPLVAPLKSRRTILHFLLALHGPRQSPPLVPQYPYFWRSARLANRYRHREQSRFLLLRSQSINPYETAQPVTDENLPGALRKWRTERMSLAGSAIDPNDPSPSSGTRIACERIVVFSKRDLVPQWGIEV